MKPWQQRAERERYTPSKPSAALPAMLALLDARLASHGDDDLPGWLARNLAGMTPHDRGALLMRILRRGYGRHVQAECADAML